MRIGIDLGGTKIAGILLDGDDAIIMRERMDTPRGTPEGIVTAMAALIRRLEARAGHACAIGIGTPGSRSPRDGTLRNSNTTELNGFPLQEALEQQLGRVVRMANDADCFALAEARLGAAIGARTVFGVITGTGTGGGFVIDGRLLAGANGIAGEWGHNPLPWAGPGEGAHDGPACWCGKRGCIETFLSGPGVAADFARHTGRQLDPPALVALAHAGDAAARACLERWCDRYARALAAVINLVDPEVVVLGGGMADIDLLHDQLPVLLPRWVFSDAVATRLLRPRHGTAAGVLGAALLAAD